MAHNNPSEALSSHPPVALHPETLQRLRTDLEQNGYAVLPSFLPSEQVQALKEGAFELIDAWKPPEDPLELSIFQTHHQEKKDPYFLTSGLKIRFFFEEAAFDPTTHALVKPKREAINKIGHALHVLDPLFRAFSHQDHIQRIATSVMNLQKPAIAQSMVILKQPGVGGEVGVHQDSAFLYTEPPSCHAFWYALEDTHKENGCLWVWPGSHRNGIDRRFVNRPENEHLAFEPDIPAPPFEEDKYVPVEVPMGSLVLLHGAVYHRSDKNLSQHSRNVYTFHVVDASCKWSELNWLQLDQPFDPLV